MICALPRHNVALPVLSARRGSEPGTPTDTKSIQLSFYAKMQRFCTRLLKLGKKKEIIIHFFSRGALHFQASPSFVAISDDRSDWHFESN